MNSFTSSTTEPSLNSFETLLGNQGHSLQSILENEVFQVLTDVPWAREALAQYVQIHRPDLKMEVLTCLEEIETGEAL